MTNDPIFRTEIDMMSDDALALWKTQFEFCKRLREQGAPASLQNEMVRVNELFREAHERLKAVSVFFPEE